MVSQPAPSAISPLESLWHWLWRALCLALLASWTAGCASMPANVPRTPSHALTTTQGTALGQLVGERRAQAHARADSAFMLLASVELAFTSRLALIDGAQRTLDLQYYAIHADTSTEVLLEHLRAAARRGVRVRILLDDFNSVGDDAQVLRLAFVPGVQLRLFNPLAGPRASLVGRVLGSLSDADRIQRRMHNKLFLADNAWGITGGRNLGDAYFGGDDKSTFIDLDVLAAGAIVQQMSASFDHFWNDDLAYPVQALLSARDLERLRSESDAVPAEQSAPATSTRRAGTVLPDVGPAAVAAARRPPLDLRLAPLTWAPASLLVDQPAKIAAEDDAVGETVVDGLLQLMQQAHQELLVIAPYFVPGAEMMRQFEQLRRRGVAIRVLTNSLASNDALAAHAGYRRYRKQLLAMGVELHEMRSDPAAASRSGIGLGSGPGGSKSATSRASLHSKAVIVDRQLAVIGSMNLDLRSQLKNSEVALLIRSRALSQAAAALIERSFAHDSYRVELQGDGLVWRAPPGAPFADAMHEPEAGLKRRLLVNLIAPFAPDEML